MGLCNHSKETKASNGWKKRKIAGKRLYFVRRNGKILKNQRSEIITMKEELKNIGEALTAGAEKQQKEIRHNTTDVPGKSAVRGIVDDMLTLLFPAYFKAKNGENADLLLERTSLELKRQITYAMSLEGRALFADTEELSLAILQKLPIIQEKLMKDVEAIYEGDPAACGTEEVLLSYPGFFAIAVYRIAHELYLLKIPYLARMMTEYAHERTGIDIHAGATIGEYFFIDHGTGIVVGETTVIGDHVKLYQGVTLGAKSFELDESGNPVKGIKRHPDIGNYVVIYANATILGGRTKIGDHAVIGGNVWITHSVPEGKTVIYSE